MLVNDNHVDNYLKEILAFVYYSSTVNKLLKICTSDVKSELIGYTW